MLSISRNIKAIRMLTVTPSISWSRRSPKNVKKKKNLTKEMKVEPKKPKKLDTLNGILFNNELTLSEKMDEAENLISNVRLFIGLRSEDEYKQTIGLFKAQEKALGLRTVLCSLVGTSIVCRFAKWVSIVIQFLREIILDKFSENL